MVFKGHFQQYFSYMYIVYRGSVILVEETRVHREYKQPATSH